MQKNLSVICSNNIEDASRFTIRKLSSYVNNLTENNIVIVPDHYSLIVENMIFDELNIECFTNISVEGISKFADRVIRESNFNSVSINKNEMLLLIKRAISLCENQFVCFQKNNTISFCKEIQSSISQLGASNITANELREKAQKSKSPLKEKLTDLSLIYETYIKLLDGKLDASELLFVFDKIIPQSNIVANTNVFFVGFDSLTEQGFSILKNLAKHSKSCIIGVIKPLNQKNDYLYDNDLLYKLDTLKNEDNLIIDYEFYEDTLNPYSKHILKNAFLPNVEQIQNNDYLSITLCGDKDEEIDYLIGQVQYLINNGAKYNDISIMCNLEDYANEIQNKFTEAGFSFYIDKSKKLSETLPAKFLLDFLNYFIQKDNKCFFEILKSGLIDIQYSLVEELENLENKFCLRENLIRDFSKYLYDENKISLLSPALLIFTDLLENSKNISKINDFCDFLRKILEIFNIKSKINDLCEEFNERQELKNEKIYSQVLDIILNILDSFSIIGEQEISIKEFLELIEFCFGEKEINALPVALDNIFVGDSTYGYFSRNKYVFLLGANASKMPIQLTDCGIILDKDINEVEGNLTINPTIKMINRRNRYKIFEDLIKAENKLFISYLAINQEGQSELPCSFVTNLQKCFKDQNKSQIEITKVCDKFMLLPNLSEEENIKKIKLNAPNLDFAKKYLRNMLRQDVSSKYTTCLYSAIKSIDNQFELNDYITENKKILEVDNKKLFFGKGRTSISQIETYFDCPYKHFATYGLKLQEVETCQFDNRMIGSFLHSVAEMFVKDNLEKLGKLTKDEVNKIATNLCRKIFNENYSYLRNNFDNFAIIKYTFNEGVALCNAINFEQQFSNFAPKMLEENISLSNNISKLSLSNGLKIGGIIDRVDFFGDYFRIIDYKSGKIENGFASLYYGDKIQLFIYQKAIQLSTNKLPAGCLYFSTKNGFEAKREKPYKFKGLLLDDASVVLQMDKKLSFENPKSNILPVSLSVDKKKIANGELALNKLNTISSEDFDTLSNYALALTENATNEIMKGNITPCPAKDTCVHCKLLPCCKFSKYLNNFERKNATSGVDIITIKEALDE